MLNCFGRKKPRSKNKNCNCNCNGAKEKVNPEFDSMAKTHASPPLPNHHTCGRDQSDGIFFSKTVQISELNGKSPSSCYACNSSDEESEHQCTDLQAQYVQYGTDLPGVAYMTVAKDDPFYNMKHPRRGKAVIFNFDHWDNTTIPDLGLSPRLGSAKDRDDLTRSLELLDFDVKSYDNLGNLEMWKVLQDLRTEDHSDCDCLLVGIMTHGERNTIYMRDGTQIPVNLIWEEFEAHKCPTLAGKPKIFIVQACRGKKYDGGTKLSGSTRNLVPELLSDETDSATFSYVIPNAADIIVAFSCPLGHYSWRNPEKGSWFIQSICKVFDKYAYHIDLQALFTTVAREVALNYQSNTTEWESDKKKQVTSTSSTLIRTVKFKPKIKTPAVPVHSIRSVSHASTAGTQIIDEPSINGDIEGDLDTSVWTSNL